MAQAIPYSYTERKRIRKSFGKRESVLERAVPADDAAGRLRRLPAKRRRTRKSASPKACRPRSSSAFPIVSHNGLVEMKFIEYNMAKPPFDVRECQQRGLTYAAAVRAKLQMIIYDRESHPAKVVKEIKEQEVYMGEVPLMTDYGSFIVNGTERVIVSQLHRSPGVFFEHDKGKTHQLGQAAVLGAHHSVPRLVARLRVRPEGHPVLPRRPPPQDAGDDPAEGHRPEPGSDPGALLRERQLPPDGHRRADGVRRRAPARRSGALRHHRQVGQRRSSRRTSASPRATCASSSSPAPRTSACRKTSWSAASSRATWSTPTPARSSPRPTTS